MIKKLTFTLLSLCFFQFAFGQTGEVTGFLMANGIEGSNLTMVVAATLGGGIFGDHCSPISDTSIISSMASASDHIDHVKTQLPYALIGGAITTVLYLMFGFFG